MQEQWNIMTMEGERETAETGWWAIKVSDARFRIQQRTQSTPHKHSSFQRSPKTESLNVEAKGV
jgi:hypothetical protein